MKSRKYCRNAARLLAWAASWLIIGCATDRTVEFESDWPLVERTWIGPEYWSNPLQDWQLSNGRIECISSGGNRNVFLLTHEMVDTIGTLEMSVTLGQLNPGESLDSGWVGFAVGIRGEFEDYRDNAVRGSGLRAGLTTDGKLFIGNLEPGNPNINTDLEQIRLELQAEPSGPNYQVMITAFSGDGSSLARLEKMVNANWLVGGVALVCSYGKVADQPIDRPEIAYGVWGFQPGTERTGNVRFWFDDWRVAGSKVVRYADRAYGPILFAQHTLSRGRLRMTAQLAPVGSEDGQVVYFQIKDQDQQWSSLGEAPIDPYSRTATFAIDDWETGRDVPYRLAFDAVVQGDERESFYFEGTIRKEPLEREEVVVAAFTGNNDLGFPNNDLTGNVARQDPDFLFFSGDQIYEGVGGYGVQRAPLEEAGLDYLRKWYLFGWTYRDLMKDRPAVSIPDDHDVYHGNIWGAGGKATPPGTDGFDAQDAGGYKMPPEWVNMVQRTQTAHLPKPFDETPVQQGIEVYYTDIVYGGISFAVIEDRKFKSAPKGMLPLAEIENGWPQNPDFDPKTQADIEGAELLGERQLEFLQEWAADWSDGIWMKVVLSQTIFANLATIPAEEYHDRVVPTLRIMRAGEYAENDKIVSDFDSNGWPQSGRNKAIREMRKGFALHIAGDQHLGSTLQYGVDQYGDAGYALCVPSVSNVWPRRWYPPEAGKNRVPNSPKYTGDFEDGFGNKMSVKAVSNPLYSGRKPANLYDRATGYGIVRFNRLSRDIRIENWERDVDPQTGSPYPGWPVIINQLDNYNKIGPAKLPEIRVNGLNNPVVQLIDESNDKVVYTIRLRGSTMKPIVPEPGSYTVNIGEPGTEKWKTIPSVKTLGISTLEVLEIDF